MGGIAMATENTLEIIADKLLAQFDKILLDNSTDFSSCDQIVKTAPPLLRSTFGRTYFGLLQVFRDGHQAVGR